jgi:replicative DNA helicase
VITVYEHLQGMGKAEEIGGLIPEPAGAVRAQCQQHPPLRGNRARARHLRKLVTASDDIATNAFNPQGKTVERILDEAEQKIMAIGEEGRATSRASSRWTRWWWICWTGSRRWPTTPWM